MKREVTKETLEAAIRQFKRRDEIAAYLSMPLSSLIAKAERFGIELPRVKGRLGDVGEAKARVWLRNYGFQPEPQAYSSPFDILCNGKRIEIKTAKFNDGEWQFNIHRHGKLNESEVDVYLLRLENVPFSMKAIHLLIPAPLKKKTISITFRSLLTRYAQYYNRLDLLNG